MAAAKRQRRRRAECSGGSCCRRRPGPRPVAPWPSAPCLACCSRRAPRARCGRRGRCADWLASPPPRLGLRLRRVRESPRRPPPPPVPLHPRRRGPQSRGSFPAAPERLPAFPGGPFRSCTCPPPGLPKRQRASGVSSQPSEALAGPAASPSLPTQTQTSPPPLSPKGTFAQTPQFGVFLQALRFWSGI